MENKIIPKKIMISYGRADASEFVGDINKVLTDAGHTVWDDANVKSIACNGRERIGIRDWRRDLNKFSFKHYFL